MKKLFSCMLAATMVAGMGVTAFAEESSDYKTSDFNDQDYGLIGAYREDDAGDYVKIGSGVDLDGGDKLYYPILVSGDELDDEEHDKELDHMFFATKRSEIDDLKASIKDEVGGRYISNADIVKETIDKLELKDGSKVSKKVYCVEVEMSDYFKNEETEVEFNIKLKNSGRTEYDSEDDSEGNLFCGEFDLGEDSDTLVDDDASTNYGYDVDFDKDGDLELEIGPDTRTVQLDEARLSTGGKDIDIENIFLESHKDIDCAFTFEVKASNQDDLYLELNDDGIKDLAVSNQRADLTFFNFPGEPEFDFSGDATFAVEDDDEDYYFYEIVDGELVESDARYDKRDGVFELRTNRLGSYVISDRELDTVDEDEDEDINDEEIKTEETTGGDATADAVTPVDNSDKSNANTGAADLIGVASALAVVSIAAAGAVVLKK